ncbi:MAG: hypothetical protein ABI824_05625 [Acidobacteriota bacterium]
MHLNFLLELGLASQNMPDPSSSALLQAAWVILYGSLLPISAFASANAFPRRDRFCLHRWDDLDGHLQLEIQYYV